MAPDRYKLVCLILQVAAVTSRCSSSSSDVRVLPSQFPDSWAVYASTDPAFQASNLSPAFITGTGYGLEWDCFYGAWHGAAVTSTASAVDIRTTSRQLFSGSGGGMASDRYKLVCLILQVRYHFKCYRSDDRFLLLLPDPLPCACAVNSFLCWLRMLLLISGDVESNSGPQIEDMLKELLAGQQKISQDIASLTTTVAALDSRLNTVEARTAVAADLVPRLNELESTVRDLKNTVEFLDHRNDDLENSLRRNNLIIYGLTETEKETPDQLLETVHELINVKLGVKYENIERWHRLGTQRKNSSPRPVIIKLIDFRTKTQILRKQENLKDKKYT
ncbi:hypothetical protein HPB51_020634 [Rhipicephalus microplus]|uniref:Uncharacterized protein n=1 Tax=Rhipicephalus microplus TaxID=6941 RepID=A0A9J6DJH3_RHIMP|nr:hypothetical protein HPB51_020634 [Rhipicephalus microplus]